MVEALRRNPALARALLGALVVVGFCFVFVFPARAWWSQHEQLARSRAQLARLEHQTRALEAQARRLQDPATVEDLARSQFGYVMPGQQGWVVIPPPPPAPAVRGATTPTTAPSPTP